MERTLAFSPLLRNSVGLNQFSDLFHSPLRTKREVGWLPPYDVVKRDENEYEIILAVAGFQESELDVSVHNERLTVVGSPVREDEGIPTELLHKSILIQPFERSFRLGEHMEVKSASLRNGLLTILVAREVPDEAKPRSIRINKDSKSLPQ